MRTIGGIINLYKKSQTKFKEINDKIKFEIMNKAVYDVNFTGEYENNYYIFKSNAKNSKNEISGFLDFSDFLLIYNGTIKINDEENNLQKIYCMIKKIGVENTLKKLKGDFVLVVYDKKNNKIFAAKSPMSLFSLCYYFDGETFAFATNLNLILKLINRNHIDIKSEYFKEYLAEYLCFPYKGRMEYTPYKNVYHLLHSTYVKIYKSKRLKYNLWNPKRKYVKCHSFDDYKISYKKILKDVLSSKIDSNIPIEISLSGGLDSSAVACLVHEIDQIKDEKLNVLLRNNKYYKSGDETKYAKEIANKTGYKLEIDEKFEKNMYFCNIEPFLKLYEPEETILISSDNHQKNIDYSYLENRLLLTGIGADQILTSNFTYILESFKSLKILKLKKQISEISNKLGLSKMQVFKIYILKSLRLKDWTKINNRLYKEMINENFSKKYKLNRRLKKRKVKKYFKDPTAQRAYEELMIYDQWNVKDSCLCLTASPFLDTDVVEFCLNMPGKYKYNGDVNKLIHREAFKDILPIEVYNRKYKSGTDDSITFSINKEWDYISSKFNKFVLEEYGIIKKGSLENLFRKLKSGAILQMVPAMRLIALEFWMESLLENEN